MAVNEYIKKFSNEIYATKNDIVKAMKTPLVDGIWTQVLEYRGDFYESLSLTNYDANRFSVCMTPSISKRLNSFERRLTTILNQYSKILQTSFLSIKFTKKYLKLLLKNITLILKILF